MIQAGSLVGTAYGVGEVMEVRKDGIVVARFSTLQTCSCCANYWYGYFSLQSVTDYGQVPSKKQIRKFDEFESDHCCAHHGEGGRSMEENEENEEEQEGPSWKRQRASPFSFSSL